MISLYSGTPGSGKSLHQAKDIYEAIQKGNPVIANFEINYNLIPKSKGDFTFIDNMLLNPRILCDYSRIYFQNHNYKEGTIKLFIDESQLLFNAREWQASGRRDWLSFFTQHRKYGYDIYLVAQFDRMIDRQIRSLIEYEYIHRKADNFGKWGKIFSFFSGKGDLFVAVKMWYPIKQKIDSQFFKAEKKYYQLYDTLNTFGS